MKKSFTKLALTLLGAQFLTTSAYLVVQATEGSEVVDPPVVSEPEPSIPVESEPVESEPVESEPVESIPDYSYPDYSYPDYEEPVYIEPPVDQEPIQITPEEEEEPTDVNLNSLHVQTLVESSLFNPQMRLAIEDYIYIIENYELEDLVYDDMMGSTLEEIEATLVANAEGVVSRPEQGPTTMTFEYPLEESEEEEATEDIQASVPAKLVLYFDDYDYLIGVGLYQAHSENLPYNAIDGEIGLSLVETDISNLYFEGLYYTSLYQAKANDQIFTALSTPSTEEGTEEVFITDFYTVLSHESHALEAEVEYSDYLRYNLNAFMNQWYELELMTEAEPEEVTEEESSEEVSEESSEEVSSEESSQVTEETTEATSDFADRYSLGEEYEGEQISTNVIEAGYLTLTSRVIKGELNQSRDDIINVMGEPTLSKDIDGVHVMTYYGKKTDLVLLLTVQVNSNGQVIKVRYEQLTPKVEEEFPITLEELFAFTEEKDLTFFNLSNLLGEPTVIEHEFNAGETISYFWTSYVDPEIQTIEAEKLPGSTKVNLFYYDAEN